MWGEVIVPLIVVAILIALTTIFGSSRIRSFAFLAILGCSALIAAAPGNEPTFWEIVWFPLLIWFISIVAREAWRRPRAPSSTFGSARFDDSKGNNRHRDGTLVVGFRTEGREEDSPVYATGHVVTIAASGAGKGRRAVLPNLLTYPGPVWVLDLKGENYLVSARARREAGHEVAVIDPFGVTGEPSSSVNLLDAINTADADCVSAADELARALVTQESEQSDSHWTEQAAFLLQGLILYAASLPDGSLLDVRKALTMSGTDTVDLLEDLASSEELAFGQVARVANAQLNTNERERSSIWSTARRFTAFLDDPRIADACRTTTTDLKLKGKSKSIFLVVPPTKMKSCRTFVCARLNAAINAQLTLEPTEDPVVFVLDEFPQLGHLANFEQQFSIGRGYGLTFWLLVQDLSQLKNAYRNWQSFLNSSTLHAFGISEFSTARYVSEKLGQTTITVTSSGSSESSSWQSSSTSSSTNTSERARALMTPDEVSRLPVSRCLVFMPQEFPMLLETMDYLHLDGLYDPHPLHDVGTAT